MKNKKKQVVRGIRTHDLTRPSFKSQIIPNWIVFRLLANIFHHPKIFQDHKWLISLFFAKMRDFARIRIFKMNLIVILRILLRVPIATFLLQNVLYILFLPSFKLYYSTIKLLWKNSPTGLTQDNWLLSFVIDLSI